MLAVRGRRHVTTPWARETRVTSGAARLRCQARAVVATFSYISLGVDLRQRRGERGAESVSSSVQGSSWGLQETRRSRRGTSARAPSAQRSPRTHFAVLRDRPDSQAAEHDHETRDVSTVMCTRLVPPGAPGNLWAPCGRAVGAC